MVSKFLPEEALFKNILDEVSPDSITELLDRELTDDDIKNNENLFTADNLVCTNCESRLGLIESICAPIVKSIQSHKQVVGKSESSIVIEKNLEFRLLFLSIIYRLGSVDRFDYNLNKALKNRIRNKDIRSTPEEVVK